jgi:hypothetical protein
MLAVKSSISQGPTAMNSLPNLPEFDCRLTVLETRVDTILPTLATKSDIDHLRAELVKALDDHMIWTIGIMLTMLIAFLGVNFAMFNATRGLIVAHLASAHATHPAPATQAIPAPRSVN